MEKKKEVYELICPEHQEKLKIYCWECEKLMCGICGSEHNLNLKIAHKTMFINKVVEYKKEDINKSQENILLTIKNLILEKNEAMNAITKILDNDKLKEQHADTIKLINKIFNDEQEKRAAAVNKIQEFISKVEIQINFAKCLTRNNSNKLNVIEKLQGDDFIKFMIDELQNSNKSNYFNEKQQEINEKIKNDIKQFPNYARNNTVYKKFSEKVTNLISTINNEMHQITINALNPSNLLSLKEVSSLEKFKSSDKKLLEYDKMREITLEIQSQKEKLGALISEAQLKLSQIIDSNTILRRNHKTILETMKIIEERKNELAKLDEKLIECKGNLCEHGCKKYAGTKMCLICKECNKNTCTECAKQCKKCLSNFCKECENKLNACKLCGKEYCANCIKKCDLCLIHVCKICSHKCSDCGNVQCKICNEHYKCKICGENRCIKCKLKDCSVCKNKSCKLCRESCTECKTKKCKNCINKCGVCKIVKCVMCMSGKCEICKKFRCDDCTERCEQCNKFVCSHCFKKGCASCKRIYCDECVKQICPICNVLVCKECIKKTCPLCSVKACNQCIEKACSKCKKEVCNSCLKNNCGSCKKEVCNSCLKNNCGSCKKEVCNSCLKNKCESCKKEVCNSCLKNKCESCKKLVCTQCFKNCITCKRIMCDECKKICSVCKKQCCGSCSKQVTKCKSIHDEKNCPTNCFHPEFYRYCSICAEQYSQSWTFDTTNLSCDLNLSDGYMKVISKGSHYPSIIGKILFAYAICQYEVIPLSLANTDEGFGICDIEIFKSVKISKKDSNKMSDNLIGVLYPSNVTGMTGNFKYQNGAVYTVTVDRLKQKFWISGPETNAIGNLDPKKIYAPCFCFNGAICYTIKPLPIF